METFTLESRDGITYLTGKVDSSNALTFEEKLRAIGCEKIILDMNDFSYISSAGLRVLLRLAKEKKDGLKIVNVPPEVYQVFEMTGFTEILDIRKQMRKISVEGCPVIGQGATGDLYRLDDETIVKVFKHASPSLIERELECSHQALLHGLPTAIAFDVVDVEGEKGIVYELLNSNTLAKELMEHPESFDRLLEEFVALLRKVDSTKVDGGAFPRISDTYRGYLDYTRKWLTKEEAKSLERMIDSIPEKETLLHGDFHAKNIMVVNGELTMIDMGDMSIGNPFYDVMGICNVYKMLPIRSPKGCLFYTGMDTQLATRVWQRFLSLYFESASEETRSALSDLLAGYTSLKLVFAPAMGAVDDEVRERLITNVKANVIPHLDGIVKQSDLLWRYF